MNDFLSKIFVILIGFKCSLALIAEWQQCGGYNWASATVCDSCCLCYTKDSYYSQCLKIGTCGTGSSAGFECKTLDTATTTLKTTTTTALSTTTAASTTTIPYNLSNVTEYDIQINRTTSFNIPLELSTFNFPDLSNTVYCLFSFFN